MPDGKKTKNTDKDGSFLLDELTQINSVASCNECTGLMYLPPDNEFEAEAYNDIYVVPQVPNEKEKEL